MSVFCTQKSSDTISQLQKELNKTRKELKEVQKSKEALDSFLAWMQEICAEKNWQFVGIHKIKNEYKEDYVGFTLFKANNEWNENASQFFSIYGYLCSGSRKVEYPCYKAELKQEFSEIPNITNTLEIIENRTQNECDYNKGIGSLGLTVIKNLAKTLHCTAIKGNRVPLKQEKEEDLKRFYDKNQFQQEESSNEIFFDMTSYKCGTADYMTLEATEAMRSQEEIEIERMILLSNRLIRTKRYDQLVQAIQDEKHRDALMRNMQIIKD